MKAQLSKCLKLAHLHFAIALRDPSSSSAGFFVFRYQQHTSQHRPPFDDLVKRQSGALETLLEFTQRLERKRGIVSRRDALISTTLLVLSARRGKTFSLRLSASREIIFIVRLASESWQRSLRLEIVISTKTSHKREWILTAFGVFYQAINFLNLEAFWWSRLIE